ncbi:hypothetical protein J4E80_009978 [Alternaria sp. BMP 0032]|nr:hypothetical protein J4E80_009978 [Alternaria sp. BMP 0032]
MGDRLTLAQRLLRDHPAKAIELLMDYLKDGKIKADTEQYIGQNTAQPMLETELNHHRGSMPPPAHHHHSSIQGSVRPNIQDTRHSIQTPPTSAGSVKSHTSGLAAAGMEKISFLSCDDDSADQAVIAKRAPGKYNLISEAVAYGRGLSAGQFEVDESIPVHTSSGGPRWVNVKHAVNLTWRRPSEYKTNMDTFHVVSGKYLDSDVVLGSDESMERQFPSGQSHSFRSVSAQPG